MLRQTRRCGGKYFFRSRAKFPRSEDTNSPLSMASSWSDAPPASWSDAPPEEARALDVWPLDESNVKLLDAVRPRAWEGPTEAEAAGEYDIIAIGSGAGGLVTAKQAARRGCALCAHLGPPRGRRLPQRRLRPVQGAAPLRAGCAGGKGGAGRGVPGRR